ncbi:hypothetical protein Sjap_021282 [Stephania japonica]|uniref:Uncharacterized protein n=1 Tax=Stephania japonica TaxID=461633 RepID=A0AAP0ELN8_9MAGN
MAMEKVREVREVRRRRRLVERMLGLGLGLELEEWGFGDGGMREGVVGVLTSQHLGSELIPTSVSLVSKLKPGKLRQH